MHRVILIVLLIGVCRSMAESKAPKRTGVADPSVRIPIQKLVPDAVFEVPGHPDWLAIDEQAWVSSAPSNLVARMDSKTDTVVALIPVGKEPGNGLAIGFGSVWVPRACPPGERGLKGLDGHAVFGNGWRVNLERRPQIEPL